MVPACRSVLGRASVDTGAFGPAPRRHLETLSQGSGVIIDAGGFVVTNHEVIGIEEFGKAIARNYWRGRISLLIQRGNVWQPIAFEF